MILRALAIKILDHNIAFSTFAQLDLPNLAPNTSPDSLFITQTGTLDIVYIGPTVAVPYHCGPLELYTLNDDSPADGYICWHAPRPTIRRADTTTTDIDVGDLTKSTIELRLQPGRHPRNADAPEQVLHWWPIPAL